MPVQYVTFGHLVIAGDNILRKNCPNVNKKCPNGAKWPLPVTLIPEQLWAEADPLRLKLQLQKDFSTNLGTNISYLLTDGVAGIYLLSSIFTQPPYTAAWSRERWQVSLVIWTHISRVAPDLDLWRTLYRLSSSTAAIKMVLKSLASQGIKKLSCWLT